MKLDLEKQEAALKEAQRVKAEQEKIQREQERI